ncbi:MAG: fumarylacetoacetate hydrolase family protein [candidate division Zixibacteria bacterium]|nr:fumarylacetoacetate hydrolase family protein [candidate division Zixibacteria bacterium]NIW48293.1 fumarylacetoacetate hydrolase [Gammaproteobacteria bacterium]NIR66813.1 fumarylacetoacetate hydrolase family protein [candidate division Zixibacteria bacterium]NIS48317.1 fumarylacetoacetate hydrolase family protein [candidate division Zixibacteria bacterium]NIT51638.1 fumarylacetoacetate hydrolase family protein [candidate division Zixibacteria bacterium]
MKLVTFTANQVSKIGALKKIDGRDFVIDLTAVEPSIPAQMVDFLMNEDRSREKAEAALAIPTEEAIMPLDEVRLEAPIPQPGKILCVGLNFRDHALESGLELPEFPTIFAKYSNVVIGPNDPIVIPKVTHQVDWEGELGFVIGKKAKHVAVDESMDYIAGYVVFNDVSARDYQLRVSQWTIGKSFDTFGPMGPSLVTKDEVPDPSNLKIRTLIDDEVMQDSNSKELIFNIPELLSFISSVITLEPGDLISTGTPSGVGFGLKPKRYLKPGQMVRVEIEKLGALMNPVVAEDS